MVGDNKVIRSTVDVRGRCPGPKVPAKGLAAGYDAQYQHIIVVDVTPFSEAERLEGSQRVLVVIVDVEKYIGVRRKKADETAVCPFPTPRPCRRYLHKNKLDRDAESLLPGFGGLPHPAPVAVSSFRSVESSQSTILTQIRQYCLKILHPF